jgi:chlorite dismutase
MNPLEIRAIIAVVLALGAGWGGYTLASHHYERLMATDRIAQDTAIQAQQVKAIADLQAQQAATVAAEKQYEALKATSDGLSQRLADSVSNYASLRGSVLSTASSAAALADAARASSTSNSELASLVRSATEACEGDAAQLTALQTWANQGAK